MTRILRIYGMMDPHVHLRGMEWSHKGDFSTETAAALAGGYTCVLDMPNTPPSTVTREALDRKLHEIGEQAVCDWGVYFGASQDDNTSEIASASADTSGLKIFCNATTGNLLVEDQELRKRIYEAWPANRVIAVHAEGATVLDILKLVRKTRKFTHFCHISTAEEIGYLTNAKAEGLPISIGVTPHHLYLSEDELPRIGWRGLMKPELKTKADQRALWMAIKHDVVDVIESDHAPHTIAEKSSEKPFYGVPGLETTLGLMLLAAKEGRISEQSVIDLISTNPRRIFGIPHDDTTYTLIDTDETWEVQDDKLWTAAKWSPFSGMQLVGRVLEVWIRGTKVFDGREQKLLVERGFAMNRYGSQS